MVRRKDSPSFCRNVVLGVLPVGYNNFMAKTLFPVSEKGEQHSKATLMAEATMSVIRQLSRPIDVLEIENVNEDDPNFHGKKLHGLRQIQIGAFRDSHERISNYWFLPGIKKYIAHFFAYTTAAKHIMWNITGTLEKQVMEDINVTNDFTPDSTQVSNQYTWQDYLFYFWPSTKSNTSNSSSSVISENSESVTKKAKKWEEPTKCDSTELTIQSNNDIGLNKQKSNPRLRATLGPQDIGIQNFLSQAWKRQWNNSTNFQASENLENESEGWQIFSDLLGVKWIPAMNNQDNDAKNGDEKFFYLDGEPIELHGGMQVTLLPNQLRMFCTDSLHIPHVTMSHDFQTDFQKKWWQRKSHIQSKPSLK